MPHFDEYGGDEWICQSPKHKGGRIQNSRVKSEWRPDITGIPGAGNCCPRCVLAFDNSPAYLPTAVTKSQITQAAKSTGMDFVEEPLNPLDFDNRADYEIQKKLQRIGVTNDPLPSVCPRCQGQLETSQGMVGEEVLVCTIHGLVWENHEDAIRRVY